MALQRHFNQMSRAHIFVLQSLLCVPPNPDVCTPQKVACTTLVHHVPFPMTNPTPVQTASRDAGAIQNGECVCLQTQVWREDVSIS